MAQNLLERRNRDLLRDLEALIRLLTQAQTPYELRPYQERVLQRCQELSDAVNLNLRYLALGQASILNDVLSRTQQATQEVRLLSSMWAIPILRATPADRLCLTTISWLHQAHPETALYPPAFISGHCAIRPFQDITPIYLFPSLEQRSLLYQPLLFHEFGHFLYLSHKPEMDALVRDLQYAVDELLMPVSQRNDRYADAMAAQRQAIAYTWYAWAQELFCDAVGFTIGGPSFLHAFSSFLSTRDHGSFYREPQDLQYSSHPVTWLRVHFLARRVTEAGFISLAKSVESEWHTVARLMNISEDYHGYYDESLDHIITQAIDDMLTEAEPRRFSGAEAARGGWSPSSDSPIRLFNWAWQVYTNDFQHYSEWEAEQTERWLSFSQTLDISRYLRLP